MQCPACGGWFDCRDLEQVFEHEGPLPHPGQDQPLVLAMLPMKAAECHQKAEEEAKAAAKITNGQPARDAHRKLAELYRELALEYERVRGLK